MIAGQPGRLIGVLIVFVMLAGPGSGFAEMPPINQAGCRVPDSIISLDPARGTEYAVVVEKETQQVYCFSYDGGFRELYRFRCSTGKVAGDKTVSGDKKTPEGIYFVTQNCPSKYLAPLYGARALPIDNPNLADRLEGRSGHSIWFHGTNKPLKERDSNGCIVLENEAINRLAENIKLLQTAVIIVDKLRWTSESSNLFVKSAILDFVDSWRESLESGRFEDFQLFYDKAAIRDIDWWEEWASLSASFKASDLDLSVEFRRPAIFKQRKTYVVLIEEILQVGGQTVRVGNKKLFLQKTDSSLRIIGEEYLGTFRPADGGEAGNPLVSICTELKASLLN